MLQNVLKIIGNEITYYVIVPLVVVALNWIKNGYEIKIKNKELGYWKLKYRRLNTFADIAMKMYKWFAINLVTLQGVRILISLWKGELFSYVVSAIIYLIINGIVIFLIYKKPNNRIEFLSNRIIKKILIGALYLIYGIAFFGNLFKECRPVAEIIFGVLLLVWLFLMLGCSDTLSILDHKYADIYVKGSGVTEQVEVGTMHKHGEWIIVNRYANGYDEQIRIKESDIVKIYYHGDPIIFLKKGILCRR